LKPAVGAVGFVNILLLPDIIVSAVLLLFLNIKFTLFVNEDVRCKDADVNDLPTNIIDPDVSVIVKKLPAGSLNVWSPVNVFEPVVAKLPVLIVAPPPLPVSTVKLNVLASPFVNVIVLRFTLAVTNELAVIEELTKPNPVICADEDIVPAGIVLPLTSGITTPNVVVSPFVNVKVFPAKDAVTNVKLAEVNKLAVAEFNEEVTFSNVVFFVSCDAVNAFNELISVVPPPPLPVLTVMLNVDASPLVNVIVFKFTLAVTNELAVIADVT
jgi:hypothetical protein